MSAPSAVMALSGCRWNPRARGPVGMYCLIAAQVAIFTIFVVAYIFYIGKSLAGPQPRDVLHTPIFLTSCLLSSSLTIHIAVRFLKGGTMMSFALWWVLTIVLGAVFLAGTIREWRHLIYEDGLTIQTNLFGTTYYSLVRLHAFHVIVCLLALGTVLAFTLRAQVRKEHSEPAHVLSIQWRSAGVGWV